MSRFISLSSTKRIFAIFSPLAVTSRSGPPLSDPAALLLQNGLGYELMNFGQQHIAADRAFFQDSGYAAVESQAILGGQVFRGNHHNWDRMPLPCFSQFGDELKSIHI